jgi:hypothetical protein
LSGNVSLLAISVQQSAFSKVLGNLSIAVGQRPHRDAW